MRKKTAKELQSEETKLRIKNCAIQLFKEKGYNNTSINDIAEKADSSIGGFYHHFKSKEDIVFYVIETLDDQYYDFFEKMIESEEYKNKNYSDKIKDIIIFVINLICSSGDESVRIAYSYLLKNEENVDILNNRQRKYFKIISALIGKAKEENLLIDNLTEEDLLSYITIVIRGIIIDWSIGKNSYDVQEKSLLLINLLLSRVMKN